jgi:hypothetical protein
LRKASHEKIVTLDAVLLVMPAREPVFRAVGAVAYAWLMPARNRVMVRRKSSAKFFST